MDTISPIYARLILREFEQRGIDSSPLFEGTAVSQAELLSGGDIPLADFLHILQTGDQLLNDAELGFLLGRKMHMFAMGAVGAGISVAPCLRDGLQLLESFTRLHASYIDIDARSTLDGLTVSILYEQETGYVERLHTETAMMLVQQYMETLFGEPVRDVRYRFAMPAPANAATYAESLHGQIVFDAQANEVDIPQRWLDQPSPFYHAELWQQAQINLTRILNERSRTEAAPYTHHVAILLRTSDAPLPDLAEVANKLRVSMRTLNRHLKAESTSFRQLKTKALIRRAKLYLRESDLSVEAIASVLGYQDPANFRRAFRKSERCTPMEYVGDNG
ncbi:MAG: AraC family transcriptional regulator ligand-binding domain-containing protein [Pseudomonadota bacterium]